MFILSEKIGPRQSQIVRDHAAEEATLKKWEDDERWIRHIIKALAGAMRMVRDVWIRTCNLIAL